MKRELIETLQVAYALALAEAKTAQTAAEGIRQVLLDANGFVAETAAVPAEAAAALADCAGIGGPQVAAMERRAAKGAGRKARQIPQRPVLSKAAAKDISKIANQKTCPYCKAAYWPKRKDQTNCLSPECRKAAHDAWKAQAAKEPKAPRPAAAPETGVEPAGNPSRLERIKALAGGGEVVP